MKISTRIIPVAGKNGGLGLVLTSASNRFGIIVSLNPVIRMLPLTFSNCGIEILISFPRAIVFTVGCCWLAE